MEIIKRYKQYLEREGGVTQISGVREEGVDMSSVDLVRNFVLEYFDGEAAQRCAYEQCWLPIERKCCRAAEGAGLHLSSWEACEIVFAMALVTLTSPGSADSPAPVGFEIYSAFVEWWEKTSSHSQSATSALVASGNAGNGASALIVQFGQAVDAVAAVAFEVVGAKFPVGHSTRPH